MLMKNMAAAGFLLVGIAVFLAMDRVALAENLMGPDAGFELDTLYEDPGNGWSKNGWDVVKPTGSQGWGIDAKEGSQMLQLQNGDGRLSRQITIETPGDYVLSTWIASRTEDGLTANTIYLELLSDSNPVTPSSSSSPDYTANPGTWIEWTRTYTGLDAGTYDVRMRQSGGVGGSDQGFVDNFSFTTLGGSPTPEPSSIILVCTSLVGLLAYAWRKRA